jgi:hypothetical protein
MRLAHLILAHSNPLQLARLVKKLSHPNADVYIHLDVKIEPALFQFIEDFPNTFFIKNNISVVWCEYSTIQATLNSMKEILETGNVYSHINLLSGADYPLKSAQHIQKFLFANADKSFMWYDDIFKDWVHGQARINNYYMGDYNFPGRYRVSSMMRKLLPNRKAPNGMVAYGRSQWLTITPACALYAIKYVHDHPSVQRFFRMTWAVDEVFFQTILCNSPLKGTLVNDNLRYIKLGDDFRPVTYTLADAPDLIASGKFYARKFDIGKDADIFEALDTAASKA